MCNSMMIVDHAEHGIVQKVGYDEHSAAVVSVAGYTYCCCARDCDFAVLRHIPLGALAVVDAVGFPHCRYCDDGVAVNVEHTIVDAAVACVFEHANPLGV